MSKQFINRAAKGRRIENKVRDMWALRGWSADRKNRPAFGGRSHASPDLFGLFDWIFIRKDRCYLVQVKTGQCPPAIVDEIGKFPYKYKEIWTYKEKTRRFKRYRWTTAGQLIKDWVIENGN